MASIKNMLLGNPDMNGIGKEAKCGPNGIRIATINNDSATAVATYILLSSLIPTYRQVIL
jgi:hypothetical protein